ncbi:MAG: hypothetical protein RPR97_09735 [Colwellia sp.]|jgi:hypothetical protein
MKKIDIFLGKEDDLCILFSYPNTRNDNETLPDTILHWFKQTLQRDGFDKNAASIRVDNNNYILSIQNTEKTTFNSNILSAYAERYPKILQAGLSAWNYPIKEIKNRKVWTTDDENKPLWDPDNTKKWRFFLTLGVGIVSHRTLQFFHYPPIRLLDPLRDSMKDPVTERCRDLLEANGVNPKETNLYETRINSTPIAAPDDQGTNNSTAADPTLGGLIPIGYFKKFEKDMIKTLIKPHDNVAGYTIPMTSYGREPRQQLGGLTLGANKAMIIEVIDGLKTPVLGSNHPFNFYYKAQALDGKGQVGSGKMLPGSESICTKLQIEDLSVVRWQVSMANDPSQDPWKVIEDAQSYWQAPEQQNLVQALVKRHASLTYDTPQGLDFWFAITLDEALNASM